jgi:hypothetical protein
MDKVGAFFFLSDQVDGVLDNSRDRIQLTPIAIFGGRSKKKGLTLALHTIVSDHLVYNASAFAVRNVTRDNSIRRSRWVQKLVFLVLSHSADR